MIQSIEIIIQSGLHVTTNALILYAKKIAYINDKKYLITDSFIDALEKTIYLWKEEYGSSNVIDCEEFLITITTDQGKETIHGKGIYPHNYGELKELLSDINDEGI